MIVYEVVFTESAEADFDSISDYIAADSPIRAISFVADLHRRTTALLSITPNAGPRIGKQRYVVFGRYVVIYRVDNNQMRVEVFLVTEGHATGGACWTIQPSVTPPHSL